MIGMNLRRPSVCFLTFDSVEEGVGRSQIVPTVIGLSELGFDLTLVSMEKSESLASSTSRILGTAGVKHVRLAFGRHGPYSGLRRVLRLSEAAVEADVYHCRSDLPYLAATLRRRRPLLWDSRSFWAEQRVAAGSLSTYNPAYAALTRLEGLASRRADGLVTLSQAAVDVLRQRWGTVPTSRRVIPTVVDLKHFPVESMPSGTAVRVCMSGSFGRNYDLHLNDAFLEAVEDVISESKGVQRVWTAGPEGWSGGDPAPDASTERLRTRYEDLPQVVASCHFGTVPIRMDTGVSAKAMMPTKVAEFWACGRPIAVTRGVGDLDGLVAKWKAGVVLDSVSPGVLRERARELIELLEDPDTPGRCRRAAEEHFDLTRGVHDLASLYEEMLA